MNEILEPKEEFEALNRELCDQTQRELYKEPYDGYEVSVIPKVLGGLLVFAGNTVYGKAPSYLKFRAVEVIARVPYHSWESAAYTLLTLFYTRESRALALSKISHFARLAQDNETMHVVVISKLAREEERVGFFRHTFIPLVFAFFYFWASYTLYLVRCKWSMELNYLFEQHAYDQYSEFLENYGDELKKKRVSSDFLLWYGRDPQNQYEFFESVRNDELIHRNRSVREIGMHRRKDM